MSATYAKVRFQGHADLKPVTALLRITNSTDKMVVGVEVRRDGEPIEPPGADERVRMIARDCISFIGPMVMNKHYGMLEEPS